MCFPPLHFSSSCAQIDWACNNAVFSFTFFIESAYSHCLCQSITNYKMLITTSLKQLASRKDFPPTFWVILLSIIIVLYYLLFFKLFIYLSFISSNTSYSMKKNINVCKRFSGMFICENYSINTNWQKKNMLTVLKIFYSFKKVILFLS